MKLDIETLFTPLYVCHVSAVRWRQSTKRLLFCQNVQTISILTLFPLNTQFTPILFNKKGVLGASFAIKPDKMKLFHLPDNTKSEEITGV